MREYRLRWFGLILMREEIETVILVMEINVIERGKKKIKKEMEWM